MTKKNNNQHNTLRYWFILFSATLLISLQSFANSTSTPPQLLVLGTGGVNGLYYPTGGALCRLLQQATTGNEIHCIAENTAGSLDNLKRLKNGLINIGIVQSDLQYRDYYGLLSQDEQTPNQQLRTLFSLHTEAFTVLARKDSQISQFRQLKNKKVNFGSLGSGQRVTAEQLVAALDWQKSDFAQITDLLPSEQSHALCSGKVDAIIFVAGHPNIAIREAADSCETNLVSIDAPIIDKITQQYPYFREAVIPSGLYHSNPNDTHTFGVSATLVATEDTPDELVYLLVKSVFEQLEQVKRLHPAFSRLTAKGMLREGLSAPLHDGAKRYYKEIGLLD